MQDLQGPKVRIGRLPGGSSTLRSGDEVTFTTGPKQGDPSCIPINYPALPHTVQAGSQILLGDGEIELHVTSAHGRDLRATVIRGGTLKERQGVHLPGVALDAAALTPKDEADLRFGLQMGVDCVALSFVRSRDDVGRLKGLIRKGGASVPVIAKLERPEAVDALDEILLEADGVMVARGDLGLALPLEGVPVLQKAIIRQANERGVLAITATQMLESMVASARPTRAEVSDVANAVLDGSDALMLSAETAVGRNPVEVVRMMARIAEAAEPEVTPGRVASRRGAREHAMSRAACELASDVGAAAIVVFTNSGYSARLVSGERPRVPVFAFTQTEEVARQVALWSGVTPIPADLPSSTEAMIASAERRLLDQGLVQPGETILVARWSAPSVRPWANFINLHRVANNTR
jgi:pyruvate kinase